MNEAANVPPITMSIPGMLKKMRTLPPKKIAEAMSDAPPSKPMTVAISIGILNYDSKIRVEGSNLRFFKKNCFIVALSAFNGISLVICSGELKKFCQEAHIFPARTGAILTYEILQGKENLSKIGCTEHGHRSFGQPDVSTFSNGFLCDDS